MDVIIATFAIRGKNEGATVMRSCVSGSRGAKGLKAVPHLTQQYYVNWS